MEYKQFRKRLAESLGRDAKDIDALVEGLAMVIRENASELDTTAIPSFGSFVPEKHDEEIITDLSTGRRMLVPPEVVLRFAPSAVLRKRLLSATPPDDADNEQYN